MGELAKLPNIVGVKDATGDLSRVPKQRIACGKDFIQLSGEDATAVGFNAQGGVGCISVTANVAPRLCAEMQEATLAGDYAKALEYPGPADAAARGDLRRAGRGRGEIRAVGAGTRL
jgi:4-hydroxy-tetrahydrodipicolinate synthase